MEGYLHYKHLQIEELNLKPSFNTYTDWTFLEGLGLDLIWKTLELTWTYLKRLKKQLWAEQN